MWAIVVKNFLGKSHIRLIFMANESSFFEVFKTALCWQTLSLNLLDSEKMENISSTAFSATR